MPRYLFPWLLSIFAIVSTIYGHLNDAVPCDAAHTSLHSVAREHFNHKGQAILTDNPAIQADPQLNITAAWMQDTAGEIQVYDWKYSDYKTKYDQIWPQGWRLSIIKTRVINNEVRYTAVWRQPSNIGEYQVYGYQYNDYRARYDALWPQGWRLQLLSQYVIGGQVKYTAVWRQIGSVDETQVYGYSYNDYRARYDTLWPLGWRLYLLENVVVNGQTLYTAVWRRSSVPETQVYGWSYTDYRAKYDALWNQGWRLYILNEYVVNGKPLYTVVWRQSTAAEIQVYDWKYEDFRSQYDALWPNGWRLKLLEVVS